MNRSFHCTHNKKLQGMIKYLLLIAAVMLLAVSAFSGCSSKSKTIRIGHKNFTEQRILGQMFAVMIEDNLGYATDVKEFGGTNVAMEALKSGDIDTYPDYTGTAYGAILGLTELKDPQAVYDYVKVEYKKQFNIDWLGQFGFNNTYTFALIPEIVDKYDLKTFSDLSSIAPELRLISTTEFLERDDGLPGVKKAYGGFEFASETSMDPGLRYAAIDSRQGDVMDAFSTDGKLVELNLIVLKDDKNFFPPYYAAPILNGKFAEANTDVAEVLNRLTNQITDQEMQQMNNDVDNLGKSERDVATAFLKSKGLIK